jgi:aldehyde dehydrogenase (NAD+)
VAAARRAFDESDWPHRPAAERAKLCERLAAAIHERSDELADLITEESGCTLFLSQVYQWSIVNAGEVPMPRGKGRRQR